MNQLDSLLEELGLTREMLTPEQVQQLETALQNEDVELVSQLLEQVQAEQGGATEEEEAPQDMMAQEPSARSQLADAVNGGGQDMMMPPPQGQAPQAPQEQGQAPQGMEAMMGGPGMEEEPEEPLPEDTSTKPGFNFMEPDAETGEFDKEQVRGVFTGEEEMGGEEPLINREAINDILDGGELDVSSETLLDVVSGKADEDLLLNAQEEGEDPEEYIEKIKSTAREELSKLIGGM